MQAVVYSRTCGNCKLRKVRCSKTQPSDQMCTNCTRRQDDCHFGHSRRIAGILRRKVSTSAQRRSDSTHGSQSHGPGTQKKTHLPAASSYGAQIDVIPQPHIPFDVEHILQHRRLPGRQDDINILFKASDSYVKSSSLAVFSENRLQGLSKRIGHKKLYELIEKMQADNNARRVANRMSYVEAHLARTSHLPLPAQEAEGYIRSYFDNVHPMYPFLDRRSFEKKVSNLGIESVQDNVPWTALYHGVLALGSQFQCKGNILPENNLAWHLFKHTLGLIPKLIGPDATLLNVQAITAMAIFSQNIFFHTLENFLVSEAARLAMYLNFNKPTDDEDANEKATVFWVIYCLEKSLSFNDALTSLVADLDIGCLIPEAPEAVLEGCDLFLSSVALARMLSIAYETLFSVKAAYSSVEKLCVGVEQIHSGLECWRMSIPKLFRPGESIELHRVSSAFCRVLLHQHFSYHSTIMAISRLIIHIGEHGQALPDRIGKISLIQSARQILELTRLIEPKDYSSIWLVAGMPLGAMFILFESIIHDPNSTVSKTNLFFMDMAAGYFSRLEYESGGYLQGSLFSEFTFLAREFVHKEQNTNQAIEQNIDSTAPTPFHSALVDINGENSEDPPPNVLHEDPYRAAGDVELLNIDYALPQSGDATLGNDSIIVDFLDMFHPTLLDEDWHW